MQDMQIGRFCFPTSCSRFSNTRVINRIAMCLQLDFYACVYQFLDGMNKFSDGVYRDAMFLRQLYIVARLLLYISKIAPFFSVFLVRSGMDEPDYQNFLVAAVAL